MGIVPNWLDGEVFQTNQEEPGCPETPTATGECKIVFYAYTDVGLYTSDVSDDPRKKPTGNFRVIAGGEAKGLTMEINGVAEAIEEADLFCSWAPGIPPLPKKKEQMHAFYKFRRIVSTKEVFLLFGRYTFPKGVGAETPA